MWRMMYGAPHWDTAAKKMWSPSPPAPRHPIKLPFLDVSPSSVIQRINQRSAHHAEDERGLTLWNTDTIDLSRTAPPDLGTYRGVYLAKLRQGSSYNRSINFDKGYSLLPNKYGSSGVGSARGDTPTSRSPSIHRRLNSLAPLDQGSARSFIPPLSAVSRRSRPGHTHEFHSDPEDDFDEEDKSEEYYYEEDEVEEEEVEEDLLAEDKSSSRPRSSATTLDSGISVFSVSNEFDAATENVK
ncbi:hypothetical protein OTU49_000965, partial [Cherax quadricarinatus]